MVKALKFENGWVRTQRFPSTTFLLCREQKYLFCYLKGEGVKGYITLREIQKQMGICEYPYCYEYDSKNLTLTGPSREDVATCARCILPGREGTVYLIVILPIKTNSNRTAKNIATSLACEDIPPKSGTDPNLTPPPP